ncbi:unnamed protein product [Ectocarpus sp. CCAP 1310/34]|nr:unnamed protein product [Ectocarpus sp. CCAP 1310/34]
MRKMFDFAILTHSNRNPIEHLYSLELNASLCEKGLNAEQPFVLAHFVGSLPPEYQQAKFLLETATALDRAEIVRIVSTMHASLPEGRKASKGQRRAEHALLASDRSGGGGAPGRGNGGHRKGGGGGGGNQKGRGDGVKAGGGGGGGDDDAGSMRGRCFRCGKKGHQVADCTESTPVRCETCKGYGHDKRKCPTEGAVFVVEVPAGGASANATALDVAEEALVGEASTWVIEYTDVTLYALLPEADEFFGASDAMGALECGLIPTFDRMDSRLLGATMWSWEEGEPHAYFSSPRAAVAHQETGRYPESVQMGLNRSTLSLFPGSGERGEWVVSSGAAGYFSAAEMVCLSQGLVFGCPRTAKENAALRVSTMDVGVVDAWVNLRSPGGTLSSSWARESGAAYTPPTTYTHVNLEADATCDGGGYYGVADFTWNADEAWTYGDRAFYDKAERIKNEVQALRAEEKKRYTHLTRKKKLM